MEGVGERQVAGRRGRRKRASRDLPSPGPRRSTCVVICSTRLRGPFGQRSDTRVGATFLFAGEKGEMSLFDATFGQESHDRRPPAIEDVFWVPFRVAWIPSGCELR